MQGQSTTQYNEVSDYFGLRLLTAMEKLPMNWEDILKKEGLAQSDFANWLSDDQERKDRFSKIRARGLERKS